MTWKSELTAPPKIIDGITHAPVLIRDDVTGEILYKEDVNAAGLTKDGLAAYCQKVIEGREFMDAAKAEGVAALAEFQVGPIIIPRDL